MLPEFSKFPRITRTIAFKLFLVITLAQALTLLLLTIVTIRVQEKNLMNNVQMSGQRVSDVIARSMRHSMLLNRREDVSEIVSSVGGHEGIEDIRIYNKQGEVVFGTRSSDLHTKVDAHAEACVSCHDGNGLEPSVPCRANALPHFYQCRREESPRSYHADPQRAAVCERRLSCPSTGENDPWSPGRQDVADGN